MNIIVQNKVNSTFTAHWRNGEGNIFSRACVSVCPQRVPTIQGPAPIPPPVQDLAPAHPCTRPQPLVPTVQGLPEHVQTCSGWTSLYRDTSWHVQNCSCWTSLYKDPAPDMFKLHYVACPVGKEGGWHSTEMPSCWYCNWFCMRWLFILRTLAKVVNVCHY